MAEHSREAEPTLFSSVYAGSVGFYARMLKAGTVCFDTEARVNHHDKSHNRCRIAGAGGVLTLTVPIEKPASWRDLWCAICEFPSMATGGEFTGVLSFQPMGRLRFLNTLLPSYMLYSSAATAGS